MEKMYIVWGEGPDKQKTVKKGKAPSATRAWLQAMAADNEEKSNWRWKVFNADEEVRLELEAEGTEITWMDLRAKNSRWKVTRLYGIEENRLYAVFEVNHRHVFKGKMFESPEQALKELYRLVSSEELTAEVIEEGEKEKE